MCMGVWRLCLLLCVYARGYSSIEIPKALDNEMWAWLVSILPGTHMYIPKQRNPRDQVQGCSSDRIKGGGLDEGEGSPAAVSKPDAMRMPKRT